MLTKKVSIFVGSTVETLPVAEAIQETLRFDANVVIWNQAVFEPGQYALESLLENAYTFDLAVFIFSEDDDTVIRKKQYKTVRDNLIFEYGLFLGFLGREKSIIVIVNKTEIFHLPSDLLGITPLEITYTNIRDILVNVGPCCTAIKRIINKINMSNELPETKSKVKKDYEAFVSGLLDNAYKFAIQNMSTKNSLIAFDIDYFTNLNNIYGRDVCDIVIETIGNLVKKTISKAALYINNPNSDEFFIFLPYNENKALNFANNLLLEIATYDYESICPNLYVTCSAGIAEKRLSEDIVHFILRTLNGIKNAKKLGGNKVCIGPLFSDMSRNIGNFFS